MEGRSSRGPSSRAPAGGAARSGVAGPRELLARKTVLEDLRDEDAASAGQVSVAPIDRALNDAVQRGLLISPASRLRRGREGFPIPAGTPEQHVVAGA